MVKFYKKVNGVKNRIMTEDALAFLGNEPIEFIAKHRKGVTKGVIEPNKIVLLRKCAELENTLYPQVVLRNTDENINHRVLLLNLGFEIEETLDALMVALGIEPIKERICNFVAYDFTKILAKPIAQVQNFY